MSTTVSILNRKTEKLDLLVTFKLNKEGLIDATWEEKSEWFKEEITSDGILTANGIFFMSNGKDFLDNLKIAFSNGSSIYVK